MAAVRIAAAVALLAGVGPAVPAARAATTAGTHRWCRLLSDSVNDETLAGTVGPGDRGDLDLRSADVATSRTSMTLVVRVRALGDATPAVGANYRLVLTAGRGDLQLHVNMHPDGDAATLSTYESSADGKQSTGVPILRLVPKVDRARSEVRVTFPLSRIRTYTGTVRPGTPIVLREGQSSLSPGVTTMPAGLSGGSAEYAVDEMRGALRYPSGAPSCVTVRP